MNDKKQKQNSIDENEFIIQFAHSLTHTHRVNCLHLIESSYASLKKRRRVWLSQSGIAALNSPSKRKRIHGVLRSNYTEYDVPNH